MRTSTRCPPAAASSSSSRPVRLKDLYPSWSPDGSRILFTSNRSGSSDNVWTMSADGSDLRQVTRATDLVDFRGGHLAAWSPDGELIVFESDGSIWTIPAEGGHRRAAL
jgi:Tol biopolymer transport system component